MKVLAFVDTHNIEKDMKKLEKKSKKSDILICAGDITWFGKDLVKILRRLSKLGKIMLIIPGNHEEGEALEKKCKKFKNIRFIHRKSFRMGKRVFFGYGGGGFAKIDKRFEACFKAFKSKLRKDDEVILITHGPPYKTKIDELFSGEHVGNKSYNKAIKALKPVLYICGHIHDSFKEKQVIGKTLIMNPGPDGEIFEI